MRIGAVVDSVQSRTWCAYTRRRFQNVEIGDGVVTHGLPLLKIADSGKLRIEDGVVLTSRPRANLVGLSRRCSIDVGPNAVVVIGSGSGLSGVAIFCAERIVLGSHVMCGGNVSIWDTDFHPLDHLARRKNSVEGVHIAPVVIADDVFIGANSLILKGVKIGARSVIGAGSVVTCDVPPDSVWAGNPARPIRGGAGAPATGIETRPEKGAEDL